MLGYHTTEQVNITQKLHSAAGHSMSIEQKERKKIPVLYREGRNVRVAPTG